MRKKFTLDSFPEKREATDPPPVWGTIIERGRTPCYALGWRMRIEDYLAITGLDSPSCIWHFFVVPRWHAGPIETYPVEVSPRTQIVGNHIMFYLCQSSNEKKMKYVMENLEGLKKVAREVLMLPDVLPDRDEFMWRRTTAH